MLLKESNVKCFLEALKTYTIALVKSSLTIWSNTNPFSGITFIVVILIGHNMIHVYSLIKASRFLIHDKI